VTGQLNVKLPSDQHSFFFKFLRVPITGDNYLEKIVRLPFHLLPLDEKRVQEFIKNSGIELPAGCADIFAAGLEANPRKVKRALNIFRLLQNLARLRQDEFTVEGERVPLKAQLLAKVVVIQSRYRKLYADLVEFPILLQELETYFVTGKKPGLSVAPVTGERSAETVGRAKKSGGGSAKTMRPRPKKISRNQPCLKSTRTCAPSNGCYVPVTTVLPVCPWPR